MLCITESQLTDSSDTASVAPNLKHFTEYYNNSEDKFCSLACLYRDSILILESSDVEGFTTLNILKATFSAKPLRVLLLYRKCSVNPNIFKETFRYLVDSKDVDVILGNFNMNALDINLELEFLSDKYVMLTNEPTHISGSLLDHVYIKKALLKEFRVNCIVKNIFISDHDAVRIILK